MNPNDQALRPVPSDERSDLTVSRSIPSGDRSAPHLNDARPHLPVLPEDESLEIRRALWALFRRKWQILAVAGFVVIPVAISTALAERLYRSSALVQIDPDPVQVLPYREIDLPSLPPNYEMLMKSEEQILKGSVLVGRVAQRLREISDVDGSSLRAEIPQLEERLSVQRLENTQLFRLGYLAPRPEVAADVANTYAEEYLKLHFDLRQQTREKVKQRLEAELRALEESVRVSDAQLVAYAQAHGISTADNAQSLIEEKLAALSKQLTEAEAEAFAAGSRLEGLKMATIESFPEKLVTPVISGLVSKLAGLEHEKTALRATFGPNWPAVVQKDKEIALVREQLTREKATALEQARQQAFVEIRTVENKRRLIAASTAGQQKLAHKLETASLQYNMSKGEADKNRKLYDGVLEQLKKSSLTSGLEFGGFRVVEQALPSNRVDSPRPLWNLSLAAIMGLALGICIALARNYWDTSITTVEELEQLDLLPVLGTLPLAQVVSPSPALLGRVRRRLLGASRPASAALAKREKAPPLSEAIDLPASPVAAEDLRSICASILLSRSHRPPRVLLVTSASPEEGKTTFATALARTLAETGAGTLLVDCDVRRGRVDRVFDITSDGGLTLFLAGHIAAAPTIHRTENDNLFVVTAGPAAPNPPALLGSDRMKAFLSDMMSSFQFIILDAPPVMPLADARVLARLVDGVLLVVRAGRVPKSIIRRACLSLEAAGGTVLGAVVNGVDDHALDSPYHYYRGYYRN